MAQNPKNRQRRNIRKVKKVRVSPFNNYWTKTNYILLGAGFFLVILGFYLMSLGNWDSTASLTLSPLVLLAAYLVVFPLAIFYRKKGTTVGETKE